MAVEQISPELQQKLTALQQILRECGHVTVAFSGGVDSTMLLRLAVDTLGSENVLALIGASVLVPAREIDEAKQLAELIGARYQIIREDPLADARVCANPPDRCYYCKTLLFGLFREIAAREGYPALLDGANADDIGDFRPGQQAARELGVRSPLLEANFTKADIRAISRMLDLPTWQKPSYACLASRIPYGTALTPELLTTIEHAEAFLHDLGFTQVRVRHHGDLARIEATAGDVARLLDSDLRARITSRLREIGYRYVTIDMQGYRTGSMNEVL